MHRILLLIDWFYPAYKAGGPIQSCYNLVHFFEDDYQFDVLTSNHDLDKNDLLDVTSNEWTSINPNTQVYYNSGTTYSISNQNYNAIYLNFFLSHQFSLFTLRQIKQKNNNTKFIIAPRGMLQAGALKVRTLRKRIYIHFFKLLRLHKNVHWHATDEQEKEDIYQHFGKKCKVTVAPNIPNTNQYLKKDITKSKGRIKLVSISLITLKKGLKYILQLFNDVHFPVEYDIYGPIKDQPYWHACQKIIEQLPPHIKVRYRNSIKPDEFHKLISKYHFFVLPTDGENFGHAIYQALNSWRPVLISDQTPWKNLQLNKAGWDLPLQDPNKWASILYRCYEMEQAEYDQLCEGAHKVARDYVEQANYREQYRELFSREMRE